MLIEKVVPDQMAAKDPRAPTAPKESLETKAPREATVLRARKATWENLAHLEEDLLA